ncbi:MAG: hypothetical protein EOM67_12010, partial [Spirochaetia bacterium]|nr:hypothetical protein [Spirochaetia bacterium]
MKNITLKEIVEKKAPYLNGMGMLVVLILGEIITLFLFIYSIYLLSTYGNSPLYVISLIISILLSMIIIPISFAGLKVIKPKEALVLTLFGRYYGTIQEDGFFFVHPFVSSINPCSQVESTPEIASKYTSK